MKFLVISLEGFSQDEYAAISPMVDGCGRLQRIKQGACMKIPIDGNRHLNVTAMFEDIGSEAKQMGEAILANRKYIDRLFELRNEDQSGVVRIYGDDPSFKDES